MKRTFIAMRGLIWLLPCLLNPVITIAAEPNLVAYWTFDEGAGTIAYDSAGGNDGNLINGPVWANGRIGGGLSFDGVNDYIRVPDSPSLDVSNIFTFSFWVYADESISPGGCVISKDGSSDTTGAYNVYAGSYSIGYETNNKFPTIGTSANALLPGTWNHVAITFDSNASPYMRIYINGTEEASGSPPWPSILSTYLLIGRRGHSTDSYYFNSILDDVRIYNKALSVDEIQQLYLWAYNPNPTEGELGVSLDVVLNWTAGIYANSHDVYLGTDFDDVNDATIAIPLGVYNGTTDVNHYDPGELQRDTTYYWRIDEVNDVNTWKGNVWSFRTSAIWKNDINFINEPFASDVIFESDPRWVKFTVKLNDPCTTYFQDSKLYPFHYNFATEWLEPFIGMTVPEYFNVTLYEANQQAALGAVILPPMTGNPPLPEFNEYGIQLIRYDAYTKEEIAGMFNVVKNHVNADPCVTAYYFPTYEQKQAAEANRTWLESQGIPIGSIAQWIEGNISYSEGWAMGDLKYFPGDQIQAAYLSGQLTANDILLTDGVPAEVPYVAGIITLSPSTPNSHVAILSKTYGIPFVYLAADSDVNKVWQLENKLTILCVQEASGQCEVQLRDAYDYFTPEEIADILSLKTPGTLDISPIEVYNSYSANTNGLLPADINHFGGKASNYGILRASIPANCPNAVAFSFDLWSTFMNQALTPSDSIVIAPGGYKLFWADNQTSQGDRHAGFKLSEGGESIGLFNIDGTTLIDGFDFSQQTANISYGRTPDGNNNWALFTGGNITPEAANPGSGSSPQEGLFINEFMADNDSIIADEFSQYDDWIEIYNAGVSAVDLGGMYLTDNLDDPMNWMIPVGISGGTLREEIADRLAGYTYPVSDLAGLSAQLAEIRNIITNPNITQFSPELQSAIVAILQDPNYGFDINRKIRFRSSTNVEDSDKFSGAGLYESFSGCLADDLDGDENGPCLCDSNETNERGVFRAIRKVMASFYNDNAYLERLRHSVNESQVGMSMLVHHSFPDEYELANGVATMEKKQGQNYWDIKLVTQKGATPVTNPEEGALPEEVSVYATTGGEISMTLIRQSNLVILGEKVMQWQDDYNDLVGLLITAAQRYEQVTGKTEYTLDLEYKKVLPGGAALPAGGLDVDQIREIPPLDVINSTCPSVPSCECSGGVYHKFSEHSYEDGNGVSIETSYCLYCPSGGCYPTLPLESWCRTVIRGYTAHPIFLYSSVSQSYSAGWHNYCEDFYFTPHLEPRISYCILKQLQEQNIRVIHLGGMTAIPEAGCWIEPYIETSGPAPGPAGIAGDFEPDGDVDMEDFAGLALLWLNNDCGLCGGKDLSCDENVDLSDLAIFADNWLEGL